MNRIKQRYNTDFLFPKQDFMMGLGSVFSISGNYYKYNYSSNPDSKAIESDWGVVGQDLKSVINQEEQNKNRKLKQQTK